jgi:SHS2 domain-containing protein
MKAFEAIDISGDVGLKIYGNSLDDLFINAVKGLFSLITDTSGIETRKMITITAHGDNRESLLIAYLNELIFHFDTHNFIGKEIKIDSLTDNSVNATITGEDFDPDRHEGKLLLKAATYHDVSIEESGGIWKAFVMFDI